MINKEIERNVPFFFPIRARGFSLLELLFVISLLLVFAGVTYPTFKKNFNSLELTNFSKKLQAIFIYLHEQAIVERKIINLGFDLENKKYWIKIKGEDYILKRDKIPEKINLQTEQQQISFYPDGSIDKVTINLKNPDGGVIKLTTKGVFGGARLQTQ